VASLSPARTRPRSSPGFAAALQGKVVSKASNSRTASYEDDLAEPERPAEMPTRYGIDSA
jgi:hypothetical protein